jgi:hypothetical protein
MKMRTLKESILTNMDNALSVDNAYAKLYNIPTVKDFEKNPYIKGNQYICWECEKLMQEYINYIDLPEFTKYGISKKSVIGLRVDIDDKFIETSLICGEFANIKLPGCGDWVSNSIPAIKKEILNFFKYIQQNPDSIKKLFDYAMKCNKDSESNGMYDCKPLNKILGY